MNSDRDEGLRVSQAEIEQMIAAAAIVRDCRRYFAARNTDLVREVIGNSTICAWRHYPEGEVFDPTSHAQYFFHAHAPDGGPPSERGHFHTFLRAEGMPSGVMPLLLPELAVADVAAPPPQAAPLKRGERDEVSHLIAIAVDVRGEPICLFTTNRWVTGETWYRAEDVTRMLDRFVIAEGEPSAVLARWIGAMIHLFRPQIAALLQAPRRDGHGVATAAPHACVRGPSTGDYLEPGYPTRHSARSRRQSSRQSGRRHFSARACAAAMAEGWEEGHAG